MLNKLKSWISKPLHLAGLLALIISALAQTKVYWRSFSPHTWPGDIAALVREDRPLDQVLTDRDWDARPVVAAVAAAPPDQAVKIPASYQSTNLRFYARGRAVERTEETAVAEMPEGGGRFSGLWRQDARVFWWAVQLAVALAAARAVSLFWSRWLAAAAVFAWLEALRLWHWPVWLAALTALLWVNREAFRGPWRSWFPGPGKPARWAALCALPCVTLLLHSVARPQPHWDVMQMWLPRAALLAEHQTLFFNALVPAGAQVPDFQGYPPVWSSLLSVFWAVMPQLCYAVAPVLLLLLVAALAEFLLSRQVPWTVVLAASNFTFLYLQEHAGYGYAQVITAAPVFLMMGLMAGDKAAGRALPLMAVLASLCAVTRMEGIFYGAGLMVMAVVLRAGWRPVVLMSVALLLTFAAWQGTMKAQALPSQSERAGIGLRLVAQQGPGEWIRRAAFIMNYKLFRKKLNAEHYVMILFVLWWLAAGRRRFPAWFRAWGPVWTYMLLIWGTLLLLYFLTPEPTLEGLERVYLNTGFFRMYSHFIAPLFVLLPVAISRTAPLLPEADLPPARG